MCERRFQSEKMAFSSYIQWNNYMVGKPIKALEKGREKESRKKFLKRNLNSHLTEIALS